MIDFLSRLWCRSAHDAPMWPSGGSYRCRRCRLEFSTGWDAPRLAGYPGRYEPKAREMTGIMRDALVVAELERMYGRDGDA